MIPELNYNQNAFLEITNLEHGGQGWELGTCLWSPIYNNAINPTKSWKILEAIQQGDIIIHLVKINRIYHWYGISTASSDLIEIINEPPVPGEWANMTPYQRLNISNFNRLDEPQNINLIFDQYDNELRKIIENNDYGQFYIEYGQEKELRVAQRYAAKCPVELYNVFNDFSYQINFNPIIGANQNIPTINEPQNPDYNPPGRIDTIVSRIVRDTRLSRTVKQENDWICQICGNRIQLPSDNYYSEGHHLQPLGGEHIGPDIRENIIVLCPTHHTEFDYGSIAINPVTRLVEHIDENNPFHNTPIAYERNDLNNDFLIYHYEQQFRRI